MWKKRITALAVAGMLALSSAPAAMASSGTLRCGSGGWPLTSKQGSPDWRDHYVQSWGTVYTNYTYVSWPFTVGSKSWSVTPGTGNGACQL